MSTFDQLMQHRRDIDACQFAELGDTRVSRYEQEEEGGGGHEWLGRLILCVLFVVAAAISAYVGV
jgi:hypothetical protein